jgi:hypothetical protein
VVENKRLGHTHALIKAQHDIAHATRVKTKGEKDGYKKRGRNAYGPDYKSNAPPTKTAVEMPG